MKIAAMSCLLSAVHARVSPGPFCFCQVRFPIHKTLMPLSLSPGTSVLRLGNCKSCRPAGCNPTASFHMLIVINIASLVKCLLQLYIILDCKSCLYSRMIRPLQVAVLLLSVHPLLDQSLLYLPPTHMTDLPC